MTHAATMDDIELLYEEAETVKRAKKAHNRTVNKKVSKVRSTIDIAKDAYKAAKHTHNVQINKGKLEIAALKNKINEQKRSIAAHKLMKKQARNTYKLVKLTNKK